MSTRNNTLLGGSKRCAVLNEDKSSSPYNIIFVHGMLIIAIISITITIIIIIIVIIIILLSTLALLLLLRYHYNLSLTWSLLLLLSSLSLFPLLLLWSFFVIIIVTVVSMNLATQKYDMLFFLSFRTRKFQIMTMHVWLEQVSELP